MVRKILPNILYLFGIVYMTALMTVSGETTAVMEKNFENFLVTLENFENTRNDVVFLLEASGYLGSEGFTQVKEFTKFLAKQFFVSAEHTRVAVVTYSTTAMTHINYIKDPGSNNLCSLQTEIDSIDFVGEYRHTVKAMETAERIFAVARPDSEKIIILMTRGVSNIGYSPVTVAQRLKSKGVVIFAISIEDAVGVEISEVASDVDHMYTIHDLDFLPGMYKRFVRDVPDDSFDLVKNSSHCNDVCDEHANCYCGTRTGISKCICNAGYFGKDGNKGRCLKCPRGTYKTDSKNTDCTACPPHSITVEEGSTKLSDCFCERGYAGNNCSPCPKGTYKADFRNMWCRPCPPHSTTVDEGSTSASDCLCDPGHRKIGVICLRLPQENSPSLSTIPPTFSNKEPTERPRTLDSSSKMPPTSADQKPTERPGATNSPSNTPPTSSNKKPTDRPRTSYIQSQNPVTVPSNRTQHSENPSHNKLEVINCATSDKHDYSTFDEVDASLPLLGKLIRSLPSERRLPKIMEILNNLYDERNEEN